MILAFHITLNDCLFNQTLSILLTINSLHVIDNSPLKLSATISVLSVLRKTLSKLYYFMIFQDEFANNPCHIHTHDHALRAIMLKSK